MCAGTLEKFVRVIKTQNYNLIPIFSSIKISFHCLFLGLLYQNNLRLFDFEFLNFLIFVRLILYLHFLIFF